MQATVPVDLFATKGIEYLLVIVFLLTLLFFWRLLNKPAVPVPRFRPVTGHPNLPSRWFQLSQDLYYHPGHSWVQPDEEGMMTVGIDDFAQKLVGKPTAIDLPEIGARVEQGAQGLQLQVDSTLIGVLSPVDGEVVATNPAVLETPDLVNQDPYGAGWLMKVKPTRMKSNMKSLLHDRLATAWMNTTEDTLRRMVSTDLGVVLQDGGVPITGIARSLSSDDWDELTRDFLLTR